jgi:hypothetical protein
VRHADAWAILSARHAVVRPDEILAPYDTTVADRQPFGGPRLSPGQFDTWLYAHVQAWRSRYFTATGAPRLVVLAGRAYWRSLVDHGLEVCLPLDGLGIGEQLRWLKQQTAASLGQEDRRSRQPSLYPEAGAPRSS